MMLTFGSQEMSSGFASEVIYKDSGKILYQHSRQWAVLKTNATFTNIIGFGNET